MKLRAGVFALVSMFLLCLPADATRMPLNLPASLKNHLSECKVRLDGAITAKGNELYLPVVPAGYQVKVNATPKVIAIAEGKPGEPPLAFLMEDNVVFLRVLRAHDFCTLTPLSHLDEKIKKVAAAGKLPADLIVPEEFVLSPDYKSVVGELGITLSGDKKNPVKHGLGGIYVTSSSSGSIILIDDKTYKKVAEYPTEGTPLGMVQIEDNLYIADQSKSRILIFNTAKRDFAGRQIDLPPKCAPKSVAALPGGKLLYVSESATGLVDCVETATGKILVKTRVPAGPSRLVMTPNGNSVLVLNPPTGQVSIISTLNQRLTASINVGNTPQSLVVSQDSRTAYVTCKTSNHLVIIDIVRRVALAGIKTGNAPTGLALAADGKTLYVACAKDNTITAFDTASKSILKEVKLPLDVDFPGAIALSATGKQLFVTSAATDTVGLLNLDTWDFTQVVIGRKSDDIVYAR